MMSVCEQEYSNARRLKMRNTLADQIQSYDQHSCGNKHYVPMTMTNLERIDSREQWNIYIYIYMREADNIVQVPQKSRQHEKQSSNAHEMIITGATWLVYAANASGEKSLDTTKVRRRSSPSHFLISFFQFLRSDAGVTTSTRRTTGRASGPWRRSVHISVMH